MLAGFGSASARRKLPSIMRDMRIRNDDGKIVIVYANQDLVKISASVWYTVITCLFPKVAVFMGRRLHRTSPLLEGHFVVRHVLSTVFHRARSWCGRYVAAPARVVFRPSLPSSAARPLQSGPRRDRLPSSSPLRSEWVCCFVLTLPLHPSLHFVELHRLLQVLEA
jgi:hypothetical protein